MSRVVFLTDVPPAPTGSGGGVAVYGLISALARAGFKVDCVVPRASPHGACNTEEFSTHVLADQAAGSEVIQDLLKKKLDQCSPELVWTFHTSCWALFAPMRSRFPHVLYSMDPSWEVEELRRRWRRLRRGLRRMKDVWGHASLVWSLKRQERLALRQANERGVAASYGSHEAREIAQRVGTVVRECTLCYPDWGVVERRIDSMKPQALLLGHLEGAHTRYGLRFFFDEVLPLWQGPEGPRSMVRIVGNGRLPETFNRPPEMACVRWVGFVPDLQEEWSSATALLVPVPLRQGIRSRIVESWCRGVPVISHPSAAVGLPMMRAGENYLAAESGREWIEAMRKLENDAVLGERLAAAGRAAYETEFSPQASAKRVESLARFAIEKFSRSLLI